MKKTFKKLFAALLAAALVLAMAVPAFAVTNATKGSITISNTVKDETYTIYRMFKLDSYNAESNTYSYTVESDWEGFFKTGAGGNYITLDGQTHPTWTAADENDSTTVAAFAKAALAWAADKKISGTKETATGGTVTFSNLDLGYYLVDSSLGALCGLNTTNPNATIKEKNEKPEIKKEVQTSAGDWSSENNAKIGDTVEYKVEIKVADGAQKYTVTDTMSKGLTFNNSSLKVTANDAVTTDYTLTSTTNGFTLVLPETYVSTLTKGTTIIVTYNATLNKDAVIDGDGNANEVKLSYGNHQNTVPSKVTTKSYQFDLVKVDGTTNKLLDGAEFELADGNTKLSFVKDTAGNYRVAAAGGLHEPRRQLGAGRRAGAVRHAGRHAGGQPRADGHAEEDGRRAPAHHHFRGLHRSVALRLYGRHLRAADAGDVCLLRQCLQTQIPRRASRPGTVPARRQIGRMIVLFPVFFTERKRPGRFS